MFKIIKRIRVALFLSAITAVGGYFHEAKAVETPIPRTAADKGKYYLLEVKAKDGVLMTVHKRVGVYETGYSRTEVNCNTFKYRDMGYSEAGPDRIPKAVGNWTAPQPGSSKADLVTFVCKQQQ